jgi:hypothetical protein
MLVSASSIFLLFNRFDARRDPRFNPWFDRYPPDNHGREPGLAMAGGGDVPPPPAVRGRGEEWKDPWVRYGTTMHLASLKVHQFNLLPVCG